MNDEQLDPELGKKLMYFREAVPSRNEATARQGRAAFLTQVQTLRTKPNVARGLSRSGWGRLLSGQWINDARRAQRQMASVLVALLLAIGLVGSTAYAAQSSLPSQMLYPVKLFIEDTQVTLATDAQTKSALQLSFANLRLQELSQIGADEDGARVAHTRLQQLIGAALQNATRLNDTDLKQTLTRANIVLDLQAVALKQLTLSTRSLMQPEISAQRTLIVSGLANPQAYRETIRSAKPTQAPLVPSVTPTSKLTLVPTQALPNNIAPSPTITTLARIAPQLVLTRLARETAIPLTTTLPLTTSAVPKVRATLLVVLTKMPGPDLPATVVAIATQLPSTRQPAISSIKATVVAIKTQLPKITIPAASDRQATKEAFKTALPKRQPTNPTQPPQPTSVTTNAPEAPTVRVPRPTRRVLPVNPAPLPTQPPAPTSAPEPSTSQPSSPATAVPAPEVPISPPAATPVPAPSNLFPNLPPGPGRIDRRP